MNCTTCHQPSEDGSETCGECRLRREATLIAAAFVVDRAHQYIPSSAVHHALLEVAWELQKNEHLEANKHGELDDIIDRLKKDKEKS